MITISEQQFVDIAAEAITEMCADIPGIFLIQEPLCFAMAMVRHKLFGEEEADETQKEGL